MGESPAPSWCGQQNINGCLSRPGKPECNAGQIGRSLRVQFQPSARFRLRKYQADGWGDLDVSAIETGKFDKTSLGS